MRDRRVPKNSTKLYDNSFSSKFKRLSEKFIFNSYVSIVLGTTIILSSVLFFRPVNLGHFTLGLKEVVIALLSIASSLISFPIVLGLYKIRNMDEIDILADKYMFDDSPKDHIPYVPYSDNMEIKNSHNIQNVSNEQVLHLRGQQKIERQNYEDDDTSPRQEGEMGEFEVR